VADTDNHRVLIWNRVPEDSTVAADVVIGQVDFTANLPNRGQPLTEPGPETLRAPRGVYLAGDRLYIADSGNNRVLVYNSLPTTNGTAADDVLCQADFLSNLPNRGAPTGASGESCYDPSDVALVGSSSIAVADTLNDRVLIFPANGVPGRAAETVLGQDDFESRGAVEPSASSMSAPTSVASDGANLLVGDTGNHRVLVFDASRLRNGAAARQVAGQPSFQTGQSSRTVTGLSAPSGMFVERVSRFETRLWVADTGNQRVVELSGIRR